MKDAQFRARGGGGRPIILVLRRNMVNQSKPFLKVPLSVFYRNHSKINCDKGLQVIPLSA